VTGSRGLGDGNSNEDSQRAYPLPPASALDPDSSSGNLSDPGSSSGGSSARPVRKAAPVPDRRKAERRAADRRAAPAASAPRDGGGSSVRPADVLRMLEDKPQMIEDGLEIYCEDGERVGVRFSTAVGEIDLLARDDAGAWVIVCVPEADAGKDIVSDLLQRMGWVRRHMGQSGEEVRGIVLLDALPDDLGYAAAAVSDSVEFKIYQMELTLESVIV
jgi:hypothetical protein